MQFRGMEDRLNPIAPEGADESTIGGYMAIHGRSPAFEGPDGMPYTVAIETEAAEGEAGAWVAYLVFVRWAANSTAIMGHVESGDLATGASKVEVQERVGETSLSEAKSLLDRLIQEKQQWLSD